MVLNKTISLIFKVQDAATTVMTNVGLDSALQAKTVSFLGYSQGCTRNQAVFEGFFVCFRPL